MSHGWDESILRDKRLCSRGRAKIFLRHLQYHSSSSRGKVHETHVDHLLSVFRREGCVRLHTPEHYVPAIISREDLTRTLRHSQRRIGHLTQEGEPITLSVPENVKITILHGEHRLRAAEKYFDPAERWWVVELYLSDLQETTKKLIQEEYAHQLKFSDGDIYRKIRFYQRLANNTQIEKWKARLSIGKGKYLQVLEKSFNNSIRRGFDRLLPFLGLWGALELGALTHILHLRCLEEFTYYLNRIYQTWRFILEDKDLFALLDDDTVCCLETLTPEASHDAALIVEMMNEGKIFEHILDQSLRDQIGNRILQVRGRILSFRTFFDDSKCMEAWVKSLRPLLPPIAKGTNFSFRQAFFHCYEPVDHNKIMIQIAGGRFQETSGTPTACRNVAYLMIFLAAMRNFPVLSRTAPHHERGKKKPVVDGSLEEYQSHLAVVAQKLGFHSPEILRLSQRNPDTVAIQSFLRRIRPPQLWELDNSRLSILTEHILGELGELAARRDRNTPPKFTHERGPIPKKFRCGLPDNSSYEADKDYLYLNDFHNYNPTSGSHLTSLAFQRDIFLSFFGDFFHSGMPTSTPTSDSDRPESSEIDSQPPYDPHDLFVDSDAEPAGNPGEDANMTTENGQTLWRAASSDYETASDLAASRPVTHVPDYRQLLEMPESNNPEVGHRYPRAPGFELSEGSSMYDFHDLRSQAQLSVILGEFLSSDTTVFVLYNWSTRQYAKFQDAPGDHISFRSQVMGLADRGYKFICFRNKDTASPLVLPDLWEQLKGKRLIFVGRELGQLEDAQWSKEKFLESLDHSHQ